MASQSAAGESLHHVVIVGGGFAGIGAARKLAAERDVRVTLLDRNNYHQFQPLLYQVATSMLTSEDVAFPLRRILPATERTRVLVADAASIDPARRTVSTTTGDELSADTLVIAAGARATYFGTPGAEEHALPLYTLDDALALRARILGLMEGADREPALIDRGALRFVVVGGGPTGVEVAGAVSDLVRRVLPSEYGDHILSHVSVHLVNHGHDLLAAFPEKAHGYARKVLERDGVRLHLGAGVDEVRADGIGLSDGSELASRCVIWAGGMQASPLVADSGLPLGQGGRVQVEPDLTVDGFPGVYVLGDIANIPGRDGTPLPQLGSVALQSGQWAARNIRADIDGKPRTGFHYKDKGTMAMIGRNAAVADIGAVELHGPPAFAAWLGVHAFLMTGVRNRIDAFIAWAWEYFGDSGASQVLDRSEAARIDWGTDPDSDAAGASDEERELDAGKPPSS